MLSDCCLSCPVLFCLSVLSVTLVYCGQTVGWIRMPLGMEVGLGPGHIVLDGNPAPPSQKRGHTPQFSAHVCCSQIAGWIKMPHSTEVDLGPGDIIVRWGSSSPHTQRDTAASTFRPTLLWYSRPPQPLLSSC